MPTAFTEKEMEIIKQKLKEEALFCMKRYGIKHTNVEQLAQAAGISKGAFYKFYASKELLFFEIIEDLHSDWYTLALNTFEDNKDKSNKKIVEKILIVVFEYMVESSLMEVMEKELDVLLRKLPQEIINNHYHDEAAHISQLIAQTGIKLKVSIEVFVSAIMMLFTSLAYKGKISKVASEFDEAFILMLEGICEKMVEE